MTPAYKWLVQNDYNNKLAKGLLSPRLASPTITSIREECAELFKKGVTPIDRHSIYLFFGGDEKDLMKTIRSFDREKLKPVQNFFKGETGDPNYKVVGLAAWLIDFPHRPFSGTPDFDAMKEKIESTILNKETPEETSFTEAESTPLVPTIPNNTETLTKKTKKVAPLPFPRITITRALALVGLTALCYFIFWMGKNNSGEKLSATNGACMYWTGDHYDAVPCTQKIPGVAVVALDSQRLKEFKRVTRPDTITYASIGKLFYHKPKRDSVDFYTTSGYHPTLHNRYLHQATKYMIDKYVLKKVQLTARD